MLIQRGMGVFISFNFIIIKKKNDDILPSDNNHLKILLQMKLCKLLNIEITMALITVDVSLYYNNRILIQDSGFFSQKIYAITRLLRLCCVIFSL